MQFSDFMWHTICSLPLRQNVLFMTARLLMYFSWKIVFIKQKTNKQTKTLRYSYFDLPRPVLLVICFQQSFNYSLRGNEKLWMIHLLIHHVSTLYCVIVRYMMYWWMYDPKLFISSQTITGLLLSRPSALGLTSPPNCFPNPDWLF